MKRVRWALLVLVLMSATALPMTAQERRVRLPLLPTTADFNILSVSSGGFCYLTEVPTFFPGTTTPSQMKLHAIAVGTASEFGRVRLDHHLTLTTNGIDTVTVSDGTLLVTFTDLGSDTLTLSYSGSGVGQQNAANQGYLRGTFVVSSGSGRFAGKAGTGLWAGTAMLPDANLGWNATDLKALVMTYPGVISAVTVPQAYTPACTLNVQVVGYLRQP